MFFASCSSSSSAIVAAGVQRLACQAVDYLQLGPQKRWVFGCRPAVYYSVFIYEHDWGCPFSDPALFASVCLHWLLGMNPNGRFCDEVCAGRGHGRAVPGRLGRGEAAPAGR